MFCVYKHTSPCGKVYIGITSKKPSQRWSNGHGYSRNPYFSRAIRKYGWENFKHEILFEGLSEYQANVVEQMQINFYDSTNRRKGYNISIGGGAMTGRKHSEEAKAKMSEKAKGRAIWCEGKLLSELHRQHLSEGHRGIRQSDETKRKRAESLKGHRVNRESLEKAVVQMSLSGEFIEEHKSMTLAAASIGKTQSAVPHISECCKGKRQQCFGFKWKYKERREQWANK